MVKSIAILGMAGAAAAYGGQVPVYPTPVPPVTPITPVPTPVYSSTMTIRTTYYPSQTDIPGAIHTNKVTSTYHFNPSTYRPDPSDVCHGGVIIFTVDGAKTSPLEVGFLMAKAATLTGSDYHDYHVYEATAASSGLTTKITTLICNKKTFERTVYSMKTNPLSWDLALSANCNTVVHPDGKAEDVCVACGVSEFLYNSGCYKCTSLPPTATPCTATEILTCTNPADSKCSAV